MVLLEDPITEDLATRFQTEEDEEIAQRLTYQYTVKPEIDCGADSLASTTVVFLLGPAAALLASTFFLQAKAVGTISVPELQRLRSPYEEEYGGHSVTHTSVVLRLGSGVTIVACEHFLPAEQAMTWAATVMGALQPKQAVIATTIAAMDYRGPGSPADEDLIFSLHTPAATAAATPAAPGGSSSGVQQAPPPLPPGTLLGGLPAALLTLCARRGLPGAAVVGVQLGPAPDARFVVSLAEAVGAVLGSRLGVDVGPQVLRGEELLAEVRPATDRMFRGSAGNSVFI